MRGLRRVGSRGLRRKGPGGQAGPCAGVRAGRPGCGDPLEGIRTVAGPRERPGDGAAVDREAPRPCRASHRARVRVERADEDALAVRGEDPGVPAGLPARRAPGAPSPRAQRRSPILRPPIAVAIRSRVIDPSCLRRFRRKTSKAWDRGFGLRIPKESRGRTPKVCIASGTAGTPSRPDPRAGPAGDRPGAPRGPRQPPPRRRSAPSAAQRQGIPLRGRCDPRSILRAACGAPEGLAPLDLTRRCGRHRRRPRARTAEHR